MTELGGLSRNQLDRLAAAEIRKISRAPTNRLLSIDADAEVVRRVAEYWPHLGLVANLRCGAWYTPPDLTSATSYFKSTDGHTTQWSFSLKRNNLHLVPLIVQQRGIIVVDSTRRGKRFPDALSKTIPIWCAVLNVASCKRWRTSWENAGLHTSPEAVSASEHSQIEAKVDQWANALLESDLDVPHLDKPLRPIFVTPTSLTTLPDLSQGDFHPVVCLSVSRQTKGGMAYAQSSTVPGRTFVYMQGAGDDHENWALGLTPAVWWDPVHHKQLLTADDEEEMEELIGDLTTQAKGNEWFVPTLANDTLSQTSTDTPGVTEGTLTGSCLTLCRGSTLEQDQQQHPTAGLFIRVDDQPPHSSSLETAVQQLSMQDPSSTEPAPTTTRVLWLGLQPGKRSLPHFNTALRRAITRVERALVSGQVDLSTADKGIVVGSSQPASTHAAGAVYVALLSMLLNDQRAPVIQSPSNSHDTYTRPKNDHTTDSDDDDDDDDDSDDDPIIDALAEHASTLTKDAVRRRLQWMLSDPGLYHVVGSAGPARAWLNRVNEVLISSQL